MLTYHDLVPALRSLDIDRRYPVIAHASLSAFGEIHGGSPVLAGALLTCFNTLIMPAFTYKTMVIPEIGPPGNALHYGQGETLNKMAEFFRPDMRADRLMGILPETLRRNPAAGRSTHPILSFVGVNAAAYLSSQTLQEPLAPLSRLHQAGGWVVLLGVDHTVNTSIHLGERMAGRKQFVRWALTPGGVVECPGFPGCSEGFQAIASDLDGIVRQVKAGPGLIQALPLDGLLQRVLAALEKDPLALLCDRPWCERCQAVRQSSESLAEPALPGSIIER